MPYRPPYRKKRQRPTTPLAFSFAGDVLDAEGLMLLAAAGKEPWHTIYQAGQGSRHDMIYNHSIGPEALRGFYADIGSQFGVLYPGPLMDWQGALMLWQLYRYEAGLGNELDLIGSPEKSIELINRIIDKAGIDPEMAQTFFTNLDRISRTTGAQKYMRPGLAKVSEELPSLTGDIKKILVIGVGLVALALYTNKELA